MSYLKKETLDFLQNCMKDVLQRLYDLAVDSDNAPSDLCEWSTQITDKEILSGAWYYTTSLAIDDLQRHFVFWRNFCMHHSEYVDFMNDLDIFANTDSYHCGLMCSLYTFISDKIFEHLGYNTFTAVEPPNKKLFLLLSEGLNHDLIKKILSL